MKSILVISHEKEVYRAICSSFHSDFTIGHASNRKVSLELLGKKRYDFIFIDIEILKGPSIKVDRYKEALEPFQKLCPAVEIIVISSQEMIREAVRAVKAGASDYLTYPISQEEVRHVTDQIHESVLFQSELDYLRDQFWSVDLLDIIQTDNSQMRLIYEKIRSVAPTRSTVLLIGETGTGKGVMANLIHHHSSRRDAQFIKVHCGAIPETLLESELFGHEKGSFTGAVRRKLGKFEIANGGTIFLDEIGTITPSAQIKFLQVLQDGTFQRVGGEETIKSDVRVIAATNTDLKKMCENNEFRKDLYYRLNVFPIEIPLLKNRAEDIPHLVDLFLRKLNKQNTKDISHVDTQVLAALRQYPWPGNIRELENIIERAYILETTSSLTPESFPGELFESHGPPENLPIDASLTLAQARQKAIDDFEKTYLTDLLARNKGRIKESAEAAGITTRQLHKLMSKYGIRKEKFKSINIDTSQTRTHSSSITNSGT